MTWSKGQPWRVVRSLDRLHTQIRAAYPSAVPPATPVTSWGSVADSAHSSTSDHYPHYYPALGSVAVVCARDFPHAPALGLDAHALADRLRLSRDPRIGYIISNRRITGPAHDWRWDTYTGSDPHDTHIHMSTVHTAAADDTSDWQIGADMLTADDRAAIRTQVALGLYDVLYVAATGRDYRGLTYSGTGSVGAAVRANLAALTAGPVVAALGEVIARESANPDEVRALLAALPQPDPVAVDEQAIVAGVLAGLTPEAIAAAIPPELAAQVADELARRIVE